MSRWSCGGGQCLQGRIQSEETKSEDQALEIINIWGGKEKIYIFFLKKERFQEPEEYKKEYVVMETKEKRISEKESVDNGIRGYVGESLDLTINSAVGKP